MNDKRWNIVRQFYMDSFGIAPELVDLMASNEILLMCVSGSSNESISRILNIDEDDIEEIISLIFDFKGWEKDLNFNPYRIYREDPDYIAFVGSIVDSRGTEDGDIDTINTMFFNCQIYSEIEEKLDLNWV